MVWRGKTPIVSGFPKAEEELGGIELRGNGTSRKPVLRQKLTGGPKVQTLGSAGSGPSAPEMPGSGLLASDRAEARASSASTEPLRLPPRASHVHANRNRATTWA